MCRKARYNAKTLLELFEGTGSSDADMQRGEELRTMLGRQKLDKICKMDDGSATGCNETS